MLQDQQEIEMTGKCYLLVTVEVSFSRMCFAASALLPCRASVSTFAPECFTTLTVSQSCSLNFESNCLGGDWLVVS